MTIMKQGGLSQYFSKVGYKRLTPTEFDPEVSHGHELQGVSRFREMFGEEDQEFGALFLYVTDSDDSPVVRQEGSLSWYDARRKQPHRSAEYRLYYDSDVTLLADFAQEDDLCIVAQPSDKHVLGSEVVVIVAQQGSTFERQLIWLFGLADDGSSRRFEFKAVTGEADRTIDFATRQLLEELGIELRDTPSELVERVLAEHKEAFPDTRYMSSLSASLVEPAMLVEDPDAALLSLMENEERIFRGVERAHVAKRLREGFGDDVDAFVSYSLSVQNRRKSRVGRALENHISRVFEAHGIKFATRILLDDGSRPDFLFPSLEAYRNGAFPAGRLTMLGSKSTCKDRWRQVLAEAKRISDKHLLTLEPAISEPQTNEMRSSHLQLVVPHAIHASYSAAQQKWLWDVRAFVRHVRDLQKA